jgi:RNA polymerase sigma factor (sigma-70 family)
MIHDYSATDYSTTYYDETFNMNFLNGKKIITDILLKLKPIEEKVLRMRYLEEATLEEVYKPLGLSSRERVRQIEAKALRSLRKELANLKDNYI